MSKYPSHFLKTAIAEKGDKTIPPETAMDAGTGRLSQAEGWGSYNSLPIGEGGIPPQRTDFNGAFYLLSQLLMWYQQGGLLNYAETFDYEPGNEILSNGTKYRCLVGNGPNTEKGVVAPGSDKKVWKNLDAPSVIAGQITPFYNAKLGGSDGRRLIPWGETVADERYVICDGGSDGRGGTVPDLTDRFLLPSAIDQVGQTGGSLTGTTDNQKISGTVGETVLTVDQMPVHGHSGSIAEAGNHAHTRGSMEGKGSFTCVTWGQEQSDGCFYVIRTYYIDMRTGSSKSVTQYGFDLSRGSSGETSTNGAHTHSLTLSNAGGGKGHTHSLDGASHAHAVTVERPPFFRMAYFVKLPE